MQNNPQPTSGYEPQEQNTPYDDQITLPAPQGVAAPSPQLSFEQGGAGVPPTPPPSATVAQKRPGRPKPLLIIGGIVLVLLILGVAGLFIVPRLTATTSNPAATPAASTPAANTANRNIYAPYLAQYRGNIRSQVAQGLHLSDAQLEGQLASGQTLSSIAAAQKISAPQLQTIVTNAFQNSFQPAVNSGKLTQKQVDALVKRMLKQPKTLDRYLAAPVRGKKGVNATPTPANS